MMGPSSTILFTYKLKAITFSKTNPLKKKKKKTKTNQNVYPGQTSNNYGNGSNNFIFANKFSQFDKKDFTRWKKKTTIFFDILDPLMTKDSQLL